ncbi:beta strand repeat-containing protein [Bacteroidota bacterium]
MKKQLLIPILLLLFNTIIFAQIPNEVNYQGLITDENGSAINGNVAITFALYESETGGTPVWTEVKNVELVNGYLNIYLGEEAGLQNMDFSKTYWLEVKVEDSNPFARTKLSSVPYSFFAYQAVNAINATTATTVVDGAITQEKLADGVQALPWGDAGGSLEGEYPNPTINSQSIIDAIGPGTITQDKLAANITAIPIGEARGDLVGFYPEPSIRPGVIITEYFSPECVTAEVLGPESVETEKIHENAVTLDKMAHPMELGQIIFWDSVANAWQYSGGFDPVAPINAQVMKWNADSNFIEWDVDGLYIPWSYTGPTVDEATMFSITKTDLTGDIFEAIYSLSGTITPVGNAITARAFGGHALKASNESASFSTIEAANTRGTALKAMSNPAMNGYVAEVINTDIMDGRAMYIEGRTVNIDGEDAGRIYDKEAILTVNNTQDGLALLTYGDAYVNGSLGISGTFTAATLVADELYINNYGWFGDNIDVVGDYASTDGNITLTNGSIELTNGDFSIGGALNVTGLTTTGDIACGGDFSVTGTSTLNGPTSIYNYLYVQDDTYIQGTLGVEGYTYLYDELRVDGPTSLHNTLEVSDYAYLQDMLVVEGDALLFSSLEVSDYAYLQDMLVVEGDALLFSSLEVSDYAYLYDMLTVDGPTYLNDNLEVSGYTYLYDELRVDGPTSLNSTLEVSDYAYLYSELMVGGPTSLNSTLEVSDYAYLYAELMVDGPTYLNNSLEVDGYTFLYDQLDVYGPTSLNNTLYVTGNTTLGGTLILPNGVAINEFSTDSTLGGNSDLAVPTEQAVKNYVDNHLSSISADNGLTENPGNNFQLGGTLIQATTITQGANNLTVNLDGIGDFEIQDAGASAVFVRDDGYVGIGTNTPSQQLEITKNMVLPTTTATTGIIYKGANTFIHSYGTNNTFVGENAGNLTMTGSQNVAYGINALNSNTNGSFNVADGMYALYSNTSGSSNVASGYYVMNSNTTGSYNVASGMDALRYNTTGNRSTAIGAYAGYNSTGSNNIYIGYQAGYNETGSEKLYIENSSSATPLIYGDFATDEITINGTLNVTDVTTLASDLAVGGNATVAGTFGVSDVTTLTSDLAVGGNATITGTSTLNGTTSINNTLDVSGNTTLGGTLILPNGVAINEFSIDSTLGGNSDVAVPTEQAVKNYVDNHLSSISADNGLTENPGNNFQFGGTLLQDTQIDQAGYNMTWLLSPSGNFSIETGVLVSGIGKDSKDKLNAPSGTAFVVTSDGDVGIGTDTPGYKLEVAGSEYIWNDLQVDGYTYLSDQLDVDGPTYLNNNMEVSGYAYLYDMLGVDGPTYLNNTLEVYGYTYLYDMLGVDGPTYLNNNLEVYGYTYLYDMLGVDGPTYLNNNLEVSGYTYLYDQLTVSGATTINNSLGVSGATTLQSTLDVTGDYTSTNGNITLTNGIFTGDGSGLSGVAAASVGFADVTAGTNLNALLIGNGGTFGPTGTGVITANDYVDATIVNADIAGGAITSLKILDNEIVDADINAVAAIAASKLAVAHARIIVGNTGVGSVVQMTGDATLASTGAIVISTDAVTSAKILNGTIADADISGTAAIADAKVVDALTINGGTIDATPIGATTASTGKFTSLQLPSGSTISEFSTDGTLADNSDLAVPTEQAVKTYVDGATGDISADNGLTENPANNFQLGGILTQETQIGHDGYDMKFMLGSGGNFRVEGIAAPLGNVKDSKDKLNLAIDPTFIVTADGYVGIHTITPNNELEVDGSVYIWSDLDVVGATTLSSTLAVTGNYTSTNGNITLTNGTFSGNGSGLTNVAATSIGFTDVAAGTNLNALLIGNDGTFGPTGTGVVTANKFITAASTSGAVDLATTEVNGILPDANVINALTISSGTIDNTPIGGTTPAGGAFTTLEVSGYAYLYDQLDVDGPTYLNNNLEVSGYTHLYDELGVIGPTYLYNNLEVDGYTYLYDMLGVAGPTYLDNNLEVNGYTYLYDQLDVTGTTTLNGDLTVSGSFTLPNGTAINEFSTDGTLADNSDNAVPTEQAVKAYVDASIASVGAFATAANVTSNSPGTLATDDFLFGSSQLDGDGDFNHYARLYFDKSKGAFRAGYVMATQWDAVNVGNYSTAFGQQNTASAGYTMAWGSNSNASASHATAAGFYATATGDYSFALGNWAEAKSYSQFTIGRYNTVVAGNLTGWTPTDRLFVVGNGTSGSSRSDALVMLKNGNTTINGELTASVLNNTPIGSTTPAGASFTTLETSGNAVVGGSLDVSGGLNISAGNTKLSVTTVTSPNLSAQGSFSIIKVTTTSGALTMPSSASDGQILFIINSTGGDLTYSNKLIGDGDAGKFIYYGSWYPIMLQDAPPPP